MLVVVAVVDVKSLKWVEMEGGPASVCSVLVATCHDAASGGDVGESGRSLLLDTDITLLILQHHHAHPNTQPYYSQNPPTPPQTHSGSRTTTSSTTASTRTCSNQARTTQSLEPSRDRKSRILNLRARQRRRAPHQP